MFGLSPSIHSAISSSVVQTITQQGFGVEKGLEMLLPFSLGVEKSHLKWAIQVDRMTTMKTWFLDWDWQVLVLVVLVRFLGFGGIEKKNQRCHQNRQGGNLKLPKMIIFQG